jgi:hypothetical protein
MKNRVLFLIAIIFIIQLNVGCGTSKNTIKTAKEIIVENEGPRISSPDDSGEGEEIHPIVGNDRDVNGCIRSAGYTWSQVQGRCLQLFNEGLALMPPVDKALPTDSDSPFGAIMQSFLIFSPDSNRVELFMPNKEAIFFHKTASQGDIKNWIAEHYKIELQNSKFIVKQNMDIILKQY